MIQQLEEASRMYGCQNATEYVQNLIGYVLAWFDRNPKDRIGLLAYTILKRAGYC